MMGPGFPIAPVWAEDSIRKKPIQFAKAATQAKFPVREDARTGSLAFRAVRLASSVLSPVKRAGYTSSTA